MVGRKRTAASRSRASNSAPDSHDDMAIYNEMVAAAIVDSQRDGGSNHPVKRRRPISSRDPQQPQRGSATDSEDMDEGMLEEVKLPEPSVQTLERSDESDSDEDIDFEDVAFNAWLNGEEHDEEPKDLELNLTAQKNAISVSKRRAVRRRPITKEERERRIQIHQVHVLCLLAHAHRRNHWCNDVVVQEALQCHLTDKVLNYLNPGGHLSQFGQAESLKNGLRQLEEMWRNKFEITERGIRRSLWAETVDDLQDYELPDDIDSCIDRADFRKAATMLQGSRDVGAQLYCALLRAAGVQARLVCSLQPLPCVTGAPTLPKPSQGQKSRTSGGQSKARAALDSYRAMADDARASPSSPTTARRRLGHPNATAYSFQPTATPPKQRPAFDAPKRIRESAYPVYWVEVLDVGHQKWQPADPLVTHTYWKPKAFEPPITDKENCLSYAIAFDKNGTAKDVTRRYAKAFTAKTRKLRVEHACEQGESWWKRAMAPFRKRRRDDLDQIEDNELAGMEAREPMPRNVQDFKTHPVYALERHLRRNEVLNVDATPSGTVGAGSRGPLEKVWRRRDVRIARTVDKWHRLGREVKPNEIPAKWLPKADKKRDSRFDDEDSDAGSGFAGTPIYTIDQTELYEAPPVRDGRVPKNKFGNIEVFVPSMVPRGGTHIVHEHGRRAAQLLGVDYAPALTGFQFKGRQGTAVLNGVVVAAEYEEAVRATIAAMGDLEQEAEDDRRRALALRTWRRFLTGLRIRERIWSGVGEEERRAADREAEMEAEMAEAPSDVTEEFEMEVDDDEGGGGFMIE